MPEEIDFNFTPQDALDYFRNKEEQRVSWSYREIWEDEHKRAFTVAKMTKANLLNDVYQSLEKAIEEGQSYEEWREKILNKLERTWIGKTYGELWDEMSPEERAKHKPPTKSERERVIKESRLKTIFRTNMFSAYQSGRYRQMSDDVENYPYWRYVTMDDDAVRPAHAKMHGVIFRHDNPFWQTHFPPNGYNCRCEVEALDDFDIEAQGLTVETDPTPYADCVDEGWDYNGGDVELAQRAIKQKAEKYPEELYEQLELDFEDEFKRLKAEKEARDKEKAVQQAKEEKAQQVKANKVKPVQTDGQIKVKQISGNTPPRADPERMKEVRNEITALFEKKENFDIDKFKELASELDVEAVVIVNNEGTLIAGQIGGTTEVDLMDYFTNILRRDKSFKGKIFIEQGDNKKKFSNEALRHLINTLKLRGGKLFHNHTKKCPLTASDVMTGIYLELGIVGAICIDESEYALFIDTNIELTEQEIEVLRKKLLRLEKICSWIGNKYLFGSFNNLFSKYKGKFRYYFAEGTKE